MLARQVLTTAAVMGLGAFATLCLTAKRRRQEERYASTYQWLKRRSQKNRVIHQQNIHPHK